MGTKPTNNAKERDSSPRPLTDLAEDLGKRQPFDLIEEELYVSMLRATDMMSTDLRELFEEVSLSNPLYNALRIVGGEQKYSPDGVTVGTIAKRMVCRQPDTTRLVDRLEGLGYVTRVISPSDGRCRLVSITEKGAKILHDLHRPVRDVHRKHFRSLTRTQMVQLEQLLKIVRQGMREQE